MPSAKKRASTASSPTPPAKAPRKSNGGSSPGAAKGGSPVAVAAAAAAKMQQDQRAAEKVAQYHAKAGSKSTPKKQRGGGGGGRGGGGSGGGGGSVQRRKSTRQSAQSGTEEEAPDAAALSSRSSSSDGGGSVSSMVREMVFPIYGRDIERFAVLGGIKFCVIFVLTLTRDLKDTLVVTSCGSEAIAFLKFYGVLPGSALFFLWHSWLSNRLGRDALWNATALPFFVFFALFGFVIYPAAIAEEAAADMLAAGGDGGGGGGGGGLSSAVCLMSHWRFAMFYVAAELYSSVSISMLFWQFANDVVATDKAKFFYPLFGQVSSLAPIVAGIYVRHYSAGAEVSEEDSIRRVMVAVSVCGLAMVALRRYFANRFLSGEDETTTTTTTKKKTATSRAITATNSSSSSSSSSSSTTTKKKKKPKMSMVESIKFLLQSEYLGCLAVLVLSYGLSIQFTDIIWKDMVKQLHPSKKAYQRYMAEFSSRVGAVTFVTIFFGSNLVKRLGWHGGAITPPACMCLLSLPFFYLVLSGSGSGSGSDGGSDSDRRGLALAVFIGALQSMMCKATKNALFDPTTQMAYIPLDEESRVKGKAAIDVMGSRLGKSGGALVLQLLNVAFGSTQGAAPAVAALFYAVVAAWLAAERRLAFLYEERVKLAKRE